MATFRNIGLQEPSTITARVATVQIARGSTNEQQEILILGDPETSNALARVLNTAPQSTDWGLAVRLVEPASTIVTVSTGSVRVHQSTAADLQVTATQAGTWNVGAITSLSSLSTGHVTVDTGSVRVHQSSAADLQVTVANLSTTQQVSSLGGRVLVDQNSTVWPVQVSSVAGLVTVRPSDTNWASSAGFHFNSSGELNVNAAFSGSTVVTVSTVQGVVTIRPESTANSSGYIPTRLTNGTAFIQLGQEFQQDSTFTSTAVTGPVLMLRAGASTRSSSDLAVMAWGSSAGNQYVSMVTDSGVSVMDSTNQAIKVNVVAGAAGGSTIVTVSTVQGIVSVRPSDTNWASSAGFRFTSSGELNVNASFSGSTIVTVSTGSVRVHQSTAADLNVTVAGYSTTANVSSVAGIVTIRPSDTNWASSAGFHFNSSGELQVVGVGGAGSTVVTVSTVQGVVTIRPESTANSSVYVPIRLSNGTAFLTPSVDYQQDSTFISTAVTGPVVMLRAGASSRSTTDMMVMAWGSTAGNQYISVVTDSGASVMDSTNQAIKVNVVAGAAGGSTIVTVSTGSVRVHQSTAADLNVTVAGYSTTANVSSVAGIVTVRPSDTNWASSAGFHFNSSGELQVVGAGGAGSTIVTVSTGSFGLAGVYDSSGTLRIVGDSVNDAIKVNVVAGAAGGSTIVTVSTGSVRVHQSTAADLNVTVAGYSTVTTVSTGSVRVHQSTAADLNVTVAGYSTVMTVSTVQGVVTIRPESTANSSVYLAMRLSNGTAFLTPAVDYTQGSTFTAASVTGPAGMFRVGAATPTSTDTWGLARASSAGSLYITPVTDTGAALLMTTEPSSAAPALVVRQVLHDVVTVASTSAFATTSLSVASSVANARIRVVAYSITSTEAASREIGFFTSNTMLWPLVLQAVSSAISGANLACSAPSYLFQTAVNEALTLRSPASTSPGFKVGVSYYVSS